ncbi:MAG: chemotaxis protein CheW, partial [Tetragenococcus halophilus]|nr:chemotaxis protein CheW [Tetragenococcus halophilus]
TEFVEEITVSLESTFVPNSKEWVHGLVNLRGEVLTLVDMKKILKDDDNKENQCYNNTIIAILDKNTIALMVDSVVGVTDVDQEDFHPKTSKEDPAVVSLLSVYDQVVNIIDLESLFLEK